jgi:uncharacterized membrane protein required for colicin V production
MTPQALDLTILLTIILSTGFACWRGFVREMLTIAGVGLSGFAAWKGGHLLVPVFNDWLGVTKDGGSAAADAVSKGTNADAATREAIEAAHRKSELIMGVISPELLAKVCAYGAAFAMVFIIMTLVSFFVTKSIEQAGLGVVDKAAGAMFGLVRGFLLIFLPYVICYVAVGKNVEKFPAWAKNSSSVPILEQIYTRADSAVKLDKIADRLNDIAKIKFDEEKHALSKNEKEVKEDLSREEKDRKPAK